MYIVVIITKIKIKKMINNEEKWNGMIGYEAVSDPVDRNGSQP